MAKTERRTACCLLACCCLLARFKGRGVYIYPPIYTPLPNSRKGHAKGTTWCIHVVEGAKLGQNRVKMGQKHLFEHPKWSKFTFGKTRF